MYRQLLTLTLLAMLAASVYARPQQTVQTSLQQIGDAVKIATQETAESAASVATNTALRAVAAGQSVEQAVRKEAFGGNIVSTTILPTDQRREKRQIEATTQPGALLLATTLQPVASAASVAQGEVARSALDSGIAAANAAIDTANASEVAAEKVANIAEKAAVAATRS